MTLHPSSERTRRLRRVSTDLLQSQRNAGGQSVRSGIQEPVELASHVEKGGLALFGGRTTIEVHKSDGAAAVSMPHSDLAVLMSKPVERN
jgi:hypothetical protein